MSWGSTPGTANVNSYNTLGQGTLFPFRDELSFLALNGRLSEDRNSRLQLQTLQRLSQSFKQHGDCLEAREPTSAFRNCNSAPEFPTGKALRLSDTDSKNIPQPPFSSVIFT